MKYRKFIVRYNLNWIFYDKKVIDVIKVYIKTLTTKKNHKKRKTSISNKNRENSSFHIIEGL